VIAHNHEDRGQCRHGNETGPAAEEQRDQQQRQRVDDPGHRRPAAVPNVGSRPGDRAGGGDAAEDRRDQIGDTLRDQLHVRAVAAADHAVGHYGGEQ
jgi:hypothetical protein